jgi:hypothetical protein
LDGFRQGFHILKWQGVFHALDGDLRQIGAEEVARDFKLGKGSSLARGSKKVDALQDSAMLRDSAEHRFPIPFLERAAAELVDVVCEIKAFEFEAGVPIPEPNWTVHGWTSREKCWILRRQEEDQILASVLTGANLPAFADPVPVFNRAVFLTKVPDHQRAQEGSHPAANIENGGMKDILELESYVFFSPGRSPMDKDGSQGAQEKGGRFFDDESPESVKSWLHSC